MAFFIIPLDNDVPSYTFNVDLENERYRFVFRYNSRIDRWVFDIFDPNENTIQSGVPLTINSELLRQNVRSIKYPGVLGCTSTVREGATDPTRFTIGVDSKLVYLESEDG